VLLNYRSSDSVAEQVTLTDILSDSITAELPNLVKDRIVLIGTTAKSFKIIFPPLQCWSVVSGNARGGYSGAHGKSDP